MRSTRASLLAGLIVASFVALASTYGILTPAWEAPDEVGHMVYVTHVVTTKSLPIQRTGELGQAHQPPLYYLLAALAVSGVDRDDRRGHYYFNKDVAWAGNGGTDVNVALHRSDERYPYHGEALALHLARGVSMLFGAATVALTIVIGWTVCPRTREVGLLAGSLVAYNPQFLFLSGAVNNDSLAAAACAATMLCVVRARNEPERVRPWLWLGICASLAILAKVSALPAILVALLALAVTAYERRSVRFFAVRLAILSAGLAIVAGWWFARNQALYGDLFGFNVYRDVFGVLQRSQPLRWSDLIEFFTTQFRSYWGVFGWMNVPAPRWFHWSMVGLVGFACAGTARAYYADHAHADGSGAVQTGARGLWLPVAAILLQEAFTLFGVRTFNSAWYQGRYLFPATASIAVFLAVGLVRSFEAVFPNRDWSRAAAASLAFALAVIASLAPFRWIAPEYEYQNEDQSTRWGESAGEPARRRLEHWDQARLATLIDDCTNAGVDCGKM